MTRLIDIAQAAGVGISSVAYVLNNTPNHKISQATRERILKAAKELNYVPNVIGRALAKGRTLQVGVLTPTMSNEFLMEMFVSMDETFERAGYSILLTSYNTPEQFKAKLQLLANRPLDGAIILPGGLKNETEALLELNARHPVVILAADSGHPDLPSVKCDGKACGYLAVACLLDRGHRHILIHNSYRDFHEGCRQAAEAFPEAHILIHTQTAVTAGEFWIWCKTQMPQATACVTYSDNEAALLYNLMADEGLSVPDDFSIVGMDGSAVSTILRPSLTTICQHGREQGIQAAELLLKRMRGEKVCSLAIQPHLQEGFSTACLSQHTAHSPLPKP